MWRTAFHSGAGHIFAYANLMAGRFILILIRFESLFLAYKIMISLWEMRSLSFRIMQIWGIGWPRRDKNINDDRGVRPLKWPIWFKVLFWRKKKKWNVMIGSLHTLLGTTYEASAILSNTKTTFDSFSSISAGHKFECLLFSMHSIIHRSIYLM